MIDNPDQAERLLARLQAALPFPARLTPELAATLRTKNTKSDIPSTCSISWVSYAGDEGGDSSADSISPENSKWQPLLR